MATTRLGLKKRLPSNIILARPRHTHTHTDCAHLMPPLPLQNGTQAVCIALGRQGMLQLCSLHTFQQFMLVCECLRVESPSGPPSSPCLTLECRKGASNNNSNNNNSGSGSGSGIRNCGLSRAGILLPWLFTIIFFSLVSYCIYVVR